jgi:hypothetical protein
VNRNSFGLWQRLLGRGLECLQNDIEPRSKTTALLHAFGELLKLGLGVADSGGAMIEGFLRTELGVVGWIEFVRRDAS